MEPMALGSAPSSPTSAATGFLPPFLIGHTDASTPKQKMLSSSPLIYRNSNYNLSTTEETVSSPILKQSLFGQLGLEATSPNDTASNTKPGPPTISLFDTIETTKPSSSYGLQNDSVSYSLNTSQVTQTENVNNWVTVFGFSVESLASILSIFSKCGTIIDKRVPSQGNWVNIKFNTKSEAMKALSLNGKVISNSVMIGVAPFFDQHGDKENVDLSRTRYASPMRMRSLKHSFVSPRSSDTVLPAQNVPQKSTGIVTKAMEYVFGW